MPRKPIADDIKARVREMGRLMNPNQVQEKLEASGLHLAKTTVYAILKEGPSRPAAKEKAQDDDAASLPEDISGDLGDLDFRALQGLIRDIVAYRRQAKADDAVRTYTALARLEIDVRERMHKLRPIKPPDPAKDPANIVAREILFRNLERMITDAERKASGCKA